MCHLGHRRRFPIKIIGRDDDVARSSEDIQRIELKPNTQLQGDLLQNGEETLERTKFDRHTLNQEKHDSVTDPTSTGRPVCGHMLKMIQKVQVDPSRWIKRRNTTLISEYQDCHTQLLKKHNISEFKSL